MLAATAPASRAAANIGSTSGSVSPGTTGATITRTGMPAFASRSITFSRRDGAAARGSIRRAITGSSVEIDTPTRVSPAAAIGANRSISRSISVPFVVIATGC